MDPKDIAILTPYNAQASEISRKLAQEGVTGVTVCSITKSQGETGSGAGLRVASQEGGRQRQGERHRPRASPCPAPQGASGAMCC